MGVRGGYWVLPLALCKQATYRLHNASEANASAHFEWKDEAKRPGALWDKPRRLWYAIEPNTSVLLTKFSLERQPAA